MLCCFVWEEVEETILQGIVITLSSSLCFSKFCFTENICRNTPWSGFSLLLDFLLSFQCKAQCKSGCLLHVSICEQEWKELQSSSKAAKLAPVCQPEPLSSPCSQLGALWGSEQGGVHPPRTGGVCVAWPQSRSRVPRVLRAGCAVGVPGVPGQVCRRVPSSVPLCCPWSPAGLSWHRGSP